MFDFTTKLDRHLVTLLDPRSFEAEQYRRLRQQIDAARRQRHVQVIAVTSAMVSDGKTLTAANLAGALATGSKRVLVIDADLRRPSMARTLGLGMDSGGLAGALQPDAPSLQKLVRQVPNTNVSVLACTVPCADTYDLLTSHALADLLGEARSRYDYILIDTPPIVPVPDSGLLRPLVDGYIVVVSAGRTPRKLLGEALNMLDAASVLGIVFNRDERPMFGFYGTHYRQYFKSYTRASREESEGRGPEQV
jgi:capsular exopolysaccharide synthesis family protein